MPEKRFVLDTIPRSGKLMLEMRAPSLRRLESHYRL